MNLTIPQTNQVIKLQQEYALCFEAVKYLQDLLTQLCHDKCDLKVNFSMLNLDQPEKKGTIDQGRIDFGIPVAMLGIFGYVKGAYEIPQPKSCINKLDFDVSETTGIRILYAVLQEKQELLTALQQQIEKILIPTMKIELTNSIPTLELNK